MSFRLRLSEPVALKVIMLGPVYRFYTSLKLTSAADAALSTASATLSLVEVDQAFTCGRKWSVRRPSSISSSSEQMRSLPYWSNRLLDRLQYLSAAVTHVVVSEHITVLHNTCTVTVRLGRSLPAAPHQQHSIWQHEVR